MTPKQRTRLMAYWWPAACRAQGWNSDDRALRLQVLSAAVKRPLETASDLDSTKDIDAVKAHLQALTDNLAAAIETGDPTIGEARRLRNVIMAETRPCLALYEKENTAHFIQTVIEGLIRWNITDRPTRVATLDDLDGKPIYRRTGPCHALKESPSQLHQAMMTLNARLHAKRKAAGHSIHDMKTLAGIKCDCSPCSKRRRAPVHNLEYAMAQTAPDPDNEPF